MLNNVFSGKNTREYYIRTSKFYRNFIGEYPLKYQRNDKIIFNQHHLLVLIREMNICSNFKFRKKNPKRYKFLKYKVINYGKD